MLFAFFCFGDLFRLDNMILINANLVLIDLD